jgi:hypothetical protein
MISGDVRTHYRSGQFYSRHLTSEAKRNVVDIPKSKERKRNRNKSDK